MPRGKATKRSKLKKDQAALTTRLIQISLKTDDHIYYSKRISASAAEDYLQELSSLKLKCPGRDVRSLQVIEKLTRLMRTILTEYHDMYVDNSHNTQANTDFTRTSSPVYSLPDEDRTENLTVNTADVPIIHLTENNDGINGIQKQDKIIENVKNALSNMVIQDEFVITQTMVTDDNCSQSILENYHDDNTVFNKIHREKDIEIVQATKNNLNDQSQCLNDFNNQQISQGKDGNLVENVKNIKVVAEIHNPHTMCNTLVNQLTPSTVKPANNLPKKSTFIKESTKINIINETQFHSGKEKKKKIVRKKKDKENEEYLKKRKRKTKAKVKNNVEATDILNKQNYQQEQKAKNVANSHYYRTETNNTKPVSKIYNSNVENDLSWVENLRFVREVSPQENDPTLNILESNFWDNFSLPNNWNDQDFEF